MPPDECLDVSSLIDVLRQKLSEIHRINGLDQILIDYFWNRNKKFRLYVTVRRTNNFLSFLFYSALKGVGFPIVEQ